MAMQDLLKNIIICPDCGGECQWSEQSVMCLQCRNMYKIYDGIPYFLKKDQYWANLPRPKMQQVVDHVKTYGFQASLKDYIPQYLHSDILDSGRADARFFLPINKESLILDIGSMWGALTFTLAEHCRHIVGVDQTLETLQLGYYRAQETGIQNVSFLGGDARQMPLKDNIFDIVILNGVLEWLGVEEEYAVEQRWGKRIKTRTNAASIKDPRILQLQGLQESLRVLKPGGTLWLAIENRVRAAYFLGLRDDHSGLLFNSLLPRKLANLYSSLAIGQPYRAYTYTQSGLRKLIRQAGFTEQIFFTSFPSYGSPEVILPLDTELLAYLLKNLSKSMTRPAKLLHSFFPTKLSAATVPNFIVAACKKSDPNYENHGRTFQQSVFDNWSTLFPNLKEPSEITLIKLKSRLERGAPVSFLVFDTKDIKPLGYLKTNRDAVGLTALEHEADTYKTIYTKCQKSRQYLAKQMFSGYLDDYFIISRTIVNGHHFKQSPFSDLCQQQSKTTFKSFIFKQADYLISLTETTPVKRITSGEFFQKSIDWLISFNNETTGPNLTFEAFWDRFVTNRLTSPRLKDVTDIPTDMLEAYRQTLKKLTQGVKLQTGPIHADYNHFNILISTEGVAIVDWEYAEEDSFPLFDALNLFAQSASECNPKYVEAIFTSDLENELASITNTLLAQYSTSQGLDLEFARACSPIFILDLLYRDYGFHKFPLRSPALFKRLLQGVLEANK